MNRSDERSAVAVPRLFGVVLACISVYEARPILVPVVFLGVVGALGVLLGASIVASSSPERYLLTLLALTAPIGPLIMFSVEKDDPVARRNPVLLPSALFLALLFVVTVAIAGLAWYDDPHGKWLFPGRSP